MNSICPMNFFRMTDTTDTTIWKPGFNSSKGALRFTSAGLRWKKKMIISSFHLQGLTIFISVISNLFIAIFFLRLVSEFSVATSETFSLFSVFQILIVLV